MGRADPSDEHSQSADDSDPEEDADEEGARKRRKVVLVRAKAAAAPAERGAEANAGNAEASKHRPRPNAANSAIGRIAQWLGQPNRAERSAAERPKKPAEKPPAPAPASKEEGKSGLKKRSEEKEEGKEGKGLLKKRSEGSSGAALAPPKTKVIKTKLTSSPKPGTEAKKANLLKRPAPAKKVVAKAAGKTVSGLKRSGEAAARSASPCSPEPARKSTAGAASKRLVKAAPVRVQKPAPVPAKIAVKTTKPAKAVQGKTNGRAADAESEDSAASPSRSSSYSRSPSPAPAPAPVTKATAKATKRPRAVSPKQVAAPPPASPKATASQPPAVTPSKRAVLSAADEGSFQDAVLDRLQQLCGENEDAKVLAEYIVVMVAGSKGRDEMAVELKPFFPEQAQAESFVDWVEECKWKFLTGGPSPAISAASPAPRAVGSPAPRSSPPADFWGPAPEAASSSTTHGSKSQEGKSRKPHVAVTKKVVLQPNPNFDDSPPSSPQQATSPAFSKAAAAIFAKPAPAPTLPAKPIAVAPAAPAPVMQPRGQKNELLDKLTKQLQLILTKLQDKTLPDETREKYQDLAKNIQTQMAKVTKPAAPARGRR